MKILVKSLDEVYTELVKARVKGYYRKTRRGESFVREHSTRRSAKPSESWDSQSVLVTRNDYEKATALILKRQRYKGKFVLHDLEDRSEFKLNGVKLTAEGEYDPKTGVIHGYMQQSAITFARWERMLKHEIQHTKFHKITEKYNREINHKPISQSVLLKRLSPYFTPGPLMDDLMETGFSVSGYSSQWWLEFTKVVKKNFKEGPPDISPESPVWWNIFRDAVKDGDSSVYEPAIYNAYIHAIDETLAEVATFVNHEGEIPNRIPACYELLYRDIQRFV